MGYWLLDHRNPYGNHFYPTRNRKLKAIVVHCTAGLEDLDLKGPDNSAEGTARYAATTLRDVSWHSGSDTDTFIDLLPYSYTAWQCVNYNSSTAGHEISKLNMDWNAVSKQWRDRVLFVTALGPDGKGGLRKKAVENGIPFRRATKAELDHAIATDGPPVGFISHADLDPSRRTDPGRNFPWSQFLNLLKAPGQLPVPPNPDVKKGPFMSLTDAQQKELLQNSATAVANSAAAVRNTNAILAQFDAKRAGSLVDKLNRTGTRLAEFQTAAKASDDKSVQLDAANKKVLDEMLADLQEVQEALAAQATVVGEGQQTLGS